MEALLNGNANPLQVAVDGTTAYSSAEQSNRRLVALMIAEASTLHAMAAENMDALMESLHNGGYVDIRNGAGWTPLIFAVSRGDVEAVKEIIKMGSNVNIAENDGWTALHFAAQAGMEEILTILLRADADAGARNTEGLTARKLAEREGFTNIVELLPEDSQEL